MGCFALFTLDVLATGQKNSGGAKRALRPLAPALRNAPGGENPVVEHVASEGRQRRMWALSSAPPGPVWAGFKGLAAGEDRQLRGSVLSRRLTCVQDPARKVGKGLQGPGHGRSPRLRQLRFPYLGLGLRRGPLRFGPGGRV